MSLFELEDQQEKRESTGYFDTEYSQHYVDKLEKRLKEQGEKISQLEQDKVELQYQQVDLADKLTNKLQAERNKSRQYKRERDNFRRQSQRRQQRIEDLQRINQNPPNPQFIVSEAEESE